MRKILLLSVLALLLLSFSAVAAWEKLWDGASTAVINYDQIDNSLRIFAVKQDTGDIYRYNNTLDQWTIVGGPAKEFVATGGHVYSLDTTGKKIYRFTGTPNDWNLIGDVPNRASHIYAGGGAVYYTEEYSNNKADIYQYKGTPNQWQRIGDGGLLDPPHITTLAAGGDESVERPKVYRLDVSGCPDEYSSTPDQWRDLGCPPQSAMKIYAAGYNVYALDYSGNIYQYYVNENAWKQIGSGSKMLAATYKSPGQGRLGATLGETILYSLSTDRKEIWKYDGVPNQWTQIETSGFQSILSEIYASGEKLFALTDRNIFYRYEPSGIQASTLTQAPDLQSPLTEEELQLADLVNQYRQDNGLTAVPVTNSLTKVARAHVMDLNTYHPDDGDCDMHSWSSHGDWTAVCYTGSAQMYQMHSKPREISESYEGEGYEITSSASPEATPQVAMDTWKGSPFHSDTILQKGTFAGSVWRAMGVAIDGNYAVVWFGEETDSAGLVPT
jgi:uncharacterized protein YkwD